MIITFFSNYFNHHQQALCDALYSIEDVEFYFVETMPMEEFRANMGWKIEKLPGYVIQAHLGENERMAAMELARCSDAVIIGDAPEWYVEGRIAANQLTFRYTERPMKEGFVKMFIPRLARKFYRLHYKNRNKELYLLGASAYAAYDYELLRSYPGKRLKFGYFPAGEALSFEEIADKKRDFNREAPVILYTGRFLKLKKVDLLIKACGSLKKKGLTFKLLLVGNGEEEVQLKSLVKELELTENTTFHDFVKPHEARELMEKSDIYVMTSGFLEGWGSVIYEALSAGCGVIASHACGCTPWLVKIDETGFIYKSGSYKSLEAKLEALLTDEKLLRKCQKGAYEQMKRLWNPQVAAERIVEFSKKKLAGEDISYEDGPLSNAMVLKNNWYKD